MPKVDIRQPPRVIFSTAWTDLFGSPDCIKMAVPAVLYFIQNNLQYIAASYLDAATFQVTYQMKILTTALCSVVMLRKDISKLQWLSLLLLTGGIALVQLPGSQTTKSEHSNSFLGLSAVTVACVLSGLAGVYFEKVLKGSTTSLWVRNTQLGVFSIIPGMLVGVLLYDGDKLREGGFFQGYNAWTWVAICCQAFGGLVVAVVVKYADNIVKNFATSLAIILSCVASVFIFDFHITWSFIAGTALVIYATVLYGSPAAQPTNVSKATTLPTFVRAVDAERKESTTHLS